MSAVDSIPETRVLAIASHVTHGYVGNTMATFVMQSLGCEVSAINTVNYSNHTGYMQFKGFKTTASQVQDLYDGLKQSHLNNFDVLLTGYIPSAEAVEVVGKIGRDLKFNASTRPGSFFWVLDPVMGDNGRLYVPHDITAQYKLIMREADLILPNQFEAELLSDTKITSLQTLGAAIQVLHRTHCIPHIIITSLALNADGTTRSSSPVDNNTTSSSTTTGDSSDNAANIPPTITIIGSTARSTDQSPRLFRIDIPAYPIYFSGTGDMFAALMVPRLREAVHAAGLEDVPSWISPDDVEASELPLAKAVERVVAGMQAVLKETREGCVGDMEGYVALVGAAGVGAGGAEGGEEGKREAGKVRRLRMSRAAEVKVVRHARAFVEAVDVERFRAVTVDVEIDT